MVVLFTVVQTDKTWTVQTTWSELAGTYSVQYGNEPPVESFSDIEHATVFHNECVRGIVLDFVDQQNGG